MKTFLKLSIFILLTLSLNAQVGIGTTTPDGALDITSTTDGLLIPRIALTSTTVIPATFVTPIASEMIYNTATAGDVTPGYYYLSTNAGPWVKFGGATGWLTTGNDDVDANSYIGTTTNFDVAFRRNGIASGKLATNNTSFGVGALLNSSGGNNTAIGNDALGTNSTGSSNVAVGYQALATNTTQRFNVAIGHWALDANRGERNIAMGYQALTTINNAAAQDNVAIGYQAMDFASGFANRNIAIGSETMRFVTGVQNVAVGHGAGSNISSGNNNIAIGISAQVPSATASNQISIGNLIYGSLGNIGIGVTGPSTKLEVDGDVTANRFFANIAGSVIPDYVFEDYFDGVSKIKSDYKFNTLEEAETFVIKNGHLPGVKSYAEFKENGSKLDITDSTIINLEKIEEQFLYITELNKKIKTQENKIEKQDKKIKALEARLERIEIFLTDQKN